MTQISSLHGSRTPFHSDVFSSFSWSVNVCGQKRWILFPPGEENTLRDPLGNLPYDLSNLLQNKSSKYYEVEQNPGEAIFVPSGWYHQVWNSADAISVNHNWFNGCNLKEIWLCLAVELKRIKAEISDCVDMDDFSQHCQVMLKATFGMDFYQFFDLLKHISHKRIQLIEDDVLIILAQGRTLGKKHAEFDLQRIAEVVTLFLEHEELTKDASLADLVRQLHIRLQHCVNI